MHGIVRCDVRLPEKTEKLARVGHQASKSMLVEVVVVVVGLDSLEPYPKLSTVLQLPLEN